MGQDGWTFGSSGSAPQGGLEWTGPRASPRRPPGRPLMCAWQSAREATELSSDPQSFWIGIQKLGDNSISYMLGEGDNLPAQEDRKLTESQVIQQLTSRLRHPVPVHIKASSDVPYGVVKHLTAALSVPKARGQITRINADVKGGSEPQ